MRPNIAPLLSLCGPNDTSFSWKVAGPWIGEGDAHALITMRMSWR